MGEVDLLRSCLYDLKYSSQETSPSDLIFESGVQILLALPGLLFQI